MDRNDPLDRAVELVDLPALINALYEHARVPRNGGLIRAPHRRDRDPSFSVFRGRRGFWLWKDHGTGESGNAMDFLTKIHGLRKEEAAELLKRFAGISDGDPLPPPPVQTEPQTTAPKEELTPKELRLLRWSQRVLQRQYPDYLKRQGIPPRVAATLGLGASPEGDVFIPIRNPQGKAIAVKKRAANPGPFGRYRYIERETGSPWLYLPGFARDPRRPVLLVEGEVNAIAAWAAVRDRYAVVGAAGASTPVDHPEAFKHRAVLIYADGDRAGERAREAWSRTIREAGGMPVPLPPLEEGDFGDLAGQRGLAALRAWILEQGRTP